MTYIDPRATRAIVAALSKAMPDPTVDHKYLADLIVMTLRGDGFGIETYPEIIAKRQAELARRDTEYHGYPKGALSVIQSAVLDCITSNETMHPGRHVGHVVSEYLLSSGYRIAPNVPEAGE